MFHCRKLRTSEAGQMVLNMSASLMLHHLALLMYTAIIITDDGIPELCIVVETLVLYSGLVLMLLMCAEAVNMFFKIVIVFKIIDNYVLKASIVAWSKLLLLLVVINICSLICSNPNISSGYFYKHQFL